MNEKDPGSKPISQLWDEALGESKDGVKPITYGTQAHLGFDRVGNFYFGGKRLEYSRKLDLSVPQSIFAAMTALGIFLAGLGAFIDAISK